MRVTPRKWSALLFILLALGIHAQAQVQWVYNDLPRETRLLPWPIQRQGDTLLILSRKGTNFDPDDKDRWNRNMHLYMRSVDIKSGNEIAQQQLNVPPDWLERETRLTGMLSFGDQMIAMTSAEGLDDGVQYKAHVLNDNGQLDPGGKMLISRLEDYRVRHRFSRNDSLMLTYYFLSNRDDELEMHFTLADQDLFVTRERVIRIDLETENVRTAGFYRDSISRSVKSVQLDNLGNIYVAGSKGNRTVVQVFSPFGKELKTIDIFPEKEVRLREIAIRFTKDGQVLIAGLVTGNEAADWHIRNSFGSYEANEVIRARYRNRLKAVFCSWLDPKTWEINQTLYHELTDKDLSNLVSSQKLEYYSKKAKEVALTSFTPSDQWDPYLGMLSLDEVRLEDNTITLVTEKSYHNTVSYYSGPKWNYGDLVLFQLSPNEDGSTEFKCLSLRKAGSVYWNLFNKSGLRINSLAIPYHSYFSYRKDSKLHLMYNAPADFAETTDQTTLENAKISTKRMQLLEATVDLKDLSITHKTVNQVKKGVLAFPTRMWKRDDLLVLMSTDRKASKINLGYITLNP